MPKARDNRMRLLKTAEAAKADFDAKAGAAQRASAEVEREERLLRRFEKAEAAGLTSPYVAPTPTSPSQATLSSQTDSQSSSQLGSVLPNWEDRNDEARRGEKATSQATAGAEAAPQQDPQERKRAKSPGRPRIDGSWAERNAERYTPSRILRVKVGTRIDVDLVERLDEFCIANRCDKQAVIETALAEFLDGRSARSLKTGKTFGKTKSDAKSESSSQHDHDQNLIDDDMIIMWEQLAKKRAKASDRQARAEFANVSVEAIAEGIRVTFQNAKAPVGSFAYCAPEIRKAVERMEARAASQPHSPPPPVVTVAREEGLARLRAFAADLRIRHPKMPAKDVAGLTVSYAEREGIDPALANEATDPPTW